MSFLSKATFCANGHVQLCQLCHVIWSDMLKVYHSPTCLFLYFHLSLPAVSATETVSVAAVSSALGEFLSLMWLLLPMLWPMAGPLI